MVDAVGKAHVAPVPSPVPAQPGGAPEPAERFGAAQKSPVSAKAKADAVAGVPERAKVDREHLKALLDKLNIVMNALDIQAKFSVHEATKQVMVRVVNVESGKLIREIPPQKILDMAAQMMELVGLVLDERA